MRITNKPLAIKLLQSAKKYITIYNPHICVYLQMHIRHSDKTWKTSREIINWINKLLKKEHTYDAWLYVYHYETCKKMSAVTRLEGRQQWIDWMVAQLKAASK